MIEKMIADYLFNDKMKAKLVNEINKNVDIPLLSEKTEAKVFDALWDSVEEVLKKAILKG